MTAAPVLDLDFLPFKLDLANRRVLYVRMTAGERAAAAFLDERSLTPTTQGVWLPLASLLEARQSVAPGVSDFIFHIGHCGSTLLSRLLSSWPQVQVLREPLPLRTMAACLGHTGSNPGEWDLLLRQLLTAWAIPQPPHTRTLVKATSTCNGLIEPILQALPESRAVLLDVPLTTYLATLLKSQAAERDARASATGRLDYLAQRTRTPAPPARTLDLPELCAMGWLAEQLRFDALCADIRYRPRLLRLDFDLMLANPRAGLQAVSSHLALAGPHLENALSSPAWGRYSKAESHPYGPEDRIHDMQLSRQRFGAQIAAGREWVLRYLDTHRDLAGTPLRLD